MNFPELVKKTRSVRRFHGEKKVTREQLLSLVDLARLTPSGGNKQHIKYRIVINAKTNSKIFDTLKWASYLTDWNGPDAKERPTGYIILMEDTTIKPAMNFDEGIVAQTILLGATDLGLGGCFIGNFQKKELNDIICPPATCNIILVIALGYPNEEIVLEDVKSDGSVEYYRTPDGSHHVPKRKLDDVVV